MSWKAEVITNAEGDWIGNRLRFATIEEAQSYVRDLAARWDMVTDARVVECEDAATYRYINGELLIIVTLWKPALKEIA